MTEVLAYVFNSFLLEGAWIAVKITAVAMVLGLALGLLLALMRLSRFKLLSGVAWCYIWIMRGTPLLLQLVFVFDALPRIGIKFDSFTTAVIGFALNEAAFAAEFIRGGILAVNRNQTVAASSLGMGPLLTMRRIVLPQAMRAILPQMANGTIAMLKGTSLASVIFVNELTFRAQQIVATNFNFFTVFIAAAVLYLAMTTVIAVVQLILERRLDPDLRFMSAGNSGFANMFGLRRAAYVEVPKPPPEPVALPDSRSGRRSSPCIGDRAVPATAWSGTQVASLSSCAEGLHKSFAHQLEVLTGEILSDVDFAVQPGEVC